MNTSTKLLKYILPYTGSILFAILCTLLIALCEMGYVSIIAETIDAIKVIDTKGLPTSVDFFKSSDGDRQDGEGLSDAAPGISGKYTQWGWTVYLKDVNAALKFVSFVVLAMLALFILESILSFGHSYIVARVGQKLILNLRNELYNKLVYLPLGFFTKNRIGDIISRGTNDMARLHDSTNSVSEAVKAGATVLVFATMMFIKSWQLTILTVIVFPPTIYVINRFGKRIKNASTLIQEKLADISSYLERTVSGIKIIKSFATEEWEQKQFAKENRAKYSVAMKRVRLSAWLIPVIGIITSAGMMSVFWLGLWLVITGRLTTGWFIGFVTMVGVVYKPVKTLGTFTAAFQQALASAERVFHIIETQPEVRDAPDAISVSNLRGDVEFKDVSFAYDGQRNVLHNINLRVKAGESVALVGPSGAGKTTMLSLLVRFYQITRGDITIDGYSISKLSLKSLREQIGLVPQETIIFGGTVRENIAYGRFDATEEEIMQAAKAANAHEFIMQLSEGYNTPIGEHGLQISGGQRQRLAIARAILKNPRILILDEATSSLDRESESLIQEALANLMKGRTTFIIAHRLSTVINADKIIVIENGKIVESGAHSDLLERSHIYQNLFKADQKIIRTWP